MAVSASAPPAIPAGLSRDQLHRIWYYLRLTRSLEERLVNLYRQTKVIGGLFRSLGQEGESVATAFALQDGDILSPLIRNMGAMLVKGAKPVEIFRQYMAKATSPTAGREQNVHFNDLQLGYLGQISHLGDMVPVMAGIAMTFRMRGEPRVGMVYVGDGAMSAGAFHEGINFAAVQHCPLVIVAEQNGYAYSTPTHKQTRVKRLADKAVAYGVPARTVDGNDVFATYEAARDMVEAARNGAGTHMLEVVTYRRRGHAEHDDQRYQPKDEIAAWEKKDPIARYEATLLEKGWATREELDAINATVLNELDAAVAECENDPLPAPETALTDVYVEPAAQRPLWYRRI